MLSSPRARYKRATRLLAAQPRGWAVEFNHQLATRILVRTLGATRKRTKRRLQGRMAATEAVLAIINTGAEAANPQVNPQVNPQAAAQTRELLDLAQTLVEVRERARMRVAGAVADLEPVQGEATRR